MLVIDLQSGFTGQQVEIRLNGKEVFKADHITTRKLFGLATSVKLEEYSRNEHIAATLIVEGMPDYTFELGPDTDEGEFIGVNLEEGKLKHICSLRPFGYG